MVTKNSKDYIFSNWKLFPYNDFVFHDRYFSDNKKYFIDNYYKYYYSNSWIKLEKNNKIIFEKEGYSIENIVLSNDGMNYSLLINNNKKDEKVFIKNWVETKITNVYYFQYSPSGKDFYYVTKNWDNYVFYKNDKEILTFSWVSYGSFYFHFTSETDYYIILTNWNDYALIRNGKIQISYDDKNQIKAIIKKKNWDIFVVRREKNIWKDIFEINGKKIIEAEKIDERYLNDWIDTFSLYPNKNNSNQYYTYITTNDTYYLFVNGFIIPDFYDYLELKNGLDIFTFASNSWQWKIVCRDITGSFPDIRYKREYFEKLLLKIKNWDDNQKNILKEKWENILKSQTSQKNKEIIKMFLDNMK